MLLSEFKYEDKLKKKQLLFEHGVYLTNRTEGEFTVLLFQIDSFYAEVYVDREEQQIGYIRAFTPVEYLDPYLSSIDISSLLSLH